MNPKRQVVEQAIRDLEEVIELMESIQSEYVKTLGRDRDPEIDKKARQAYYERQNIANRLFHDYSSAHPNERFYEEKPTPVFDYHDFHHTKYGTRNHPRVEPAITDRRTRSPHSIPRNIRIIKNFIEQLKTKLKKRKDLRENKNILNPKRQVIEQAIMDLEENKETVRQIYEDWLDAGGDSPLGAGKHSTPHTDAMRKAREERSNIAVRLFRDYVDFQGNPVVGNSNEQYYDPNPTPVLKLSDFGRSNPIITGYSTMSLPRAERTIYRIDKFIGQLKTKLNKRKDLQEEKIIMKIDKNYIKQLVKEALDESRYKDDIMAGEEALEKHMRSKERSPFSSKSSEPRNNMSSEEIEDTMTSLAKQLQAQGFGISLKINGVKKV